MLRSLHIDLRSLLHFTLEQSASPRSQAGPAIIEFSIRLQVILPVS